MNASPLSYLEAAGPAARPLTTLAWGLGAISVAVVVIIAIALSGAIWRRRHSAPFEHLETAGRPGLGLGWIYVGLGISVPVLAACTVWILVVLGQVLHPRTSPTLTLQVAAHQWWWGIRYLGADGQPTFTTANEIHIPVGQPVRVELSSTDVIHSFWVPKLAGKMDVIPGVTNVTWIEASSPGRYRGQCGEYCGLQHARMAFYVIADTPTDFAAWRAHQVAPPSADLPANAAAGQAVFGARCASCHAVSGTDFGGEVGPDLSHLATRGTLAAGLLPNSRAELEAWIDNPQGLKPGALMPKVPLSANERAELVSYLQTLN